VIVRGDDGVLYYVGVTAALREGAITAAARVSLFTRLLPSKQSVRLASEFELLFEDFLPRVGLRALTLGASAAGAVLMSLSTVIVAINARLLRFRR